MATVFGVEVGSAAKATGTRVPGRQDRQLSADYRRQAVATALANVSRQQAMALQPDPTLGAPFSSFPDNRLTVAQMGPGEPAENFPLGAEPRQWVYRVGRNFPTTPDTDRGISGRLLRALADASWLVRRCIEIRKHEMCALDWDIVPRGQNAAERRKNADRHSALIRHLREFWRYPEAYFAFADDRGDLDAEQDAALRASGRWERRGLLPWQDWLNACLEDYFVGDWLSLWPQRTLGNEMLGVRRVDGETIKALIDLDGRIPPPPMPAWQQYLYGVPRASWSSDEFYFMPRDVRNMTTFGFSLVQQCLVMVNLALKFDQWNTAAYTESTIPMGLLEAPQGLTAQQIQDVADFLNGAIADLAARQRVYPVPAGTKWQAIKPFDFNSEFAYFLVEATAGCFDVHSQELGIVRQTGGLGSKGHAEQQEAIRRRKSFVPLARWFEQVVTRVINEQWRDEGGAELEFRFVDLVHDETAMRFEAYDKALRSGQVDLDELLEAQGEEGPHVGRFVQMPQGTLFLDKKFILTANGIVPFRLPEQGEPTIFGPHQPPPDGERVPHPGAVPQAGDGGPKAEKTAADPAESRRQRREREFLLAWLLWWRAFLRRASQAPVQRHEQAGRALRLSREDELALAMLLQAALREPAYAEAFAELRKRAGLPERESTTPTRSDRYRLEYDSQAHAGEIAQTYGTDLDNEYQRLLTETQLETDEAVRAEKIRGALVEWAHDRAEWKGRQVAATELTDAEAQAATDFATQNPRVLRAFRWRAVMDNRTCDVCRGLDGQIIDPAQGPLPPSHPGCRCTLEPVSPAADDGTD